MSLRDEQLEGAEIVARGTFKLDRRRAMDKLARFQLEDPHRYVLELVAAAVRAGATRIEVRNDSDDLEIGWDGAPPNAEELDFLFDHIFSRGNEDRPRMLQHLAQGLFGAIGLRPSWVRVERPGVRYDLTDPVAIGREACERTEGVFVHVRERFGWGVVKEFLNPFDAAHEARLLNDLAWTCPVPLIVNSKDIRRELPPLELTAHEDHTVVVVRDGVIVHRESVPVGPLRLAGAVVDDTLDLNASRSKIVRNEGWDRLLGQLLQTAVQRVQDQARELSDGRVLDDELRMAGLDLLFRHLRHAAPLAVLPLFVDGAGRAFSLEQLRAAPVVYTYVDVAPDPTLEAPHFPVKGLQFDCLVERVGKTEHGSGLLEDRHQGRERRRQLSQVAAPLSFLPAALVERSFDVDGVQGVVALGAVEPPRAATIELRVQGLPVETVRTEKLPKGLSLRASHPALKTDDRFERVLHDEAWLRLMSTCVEQGEALLLEQAGLHPRHPLIRVSLMQWLHALRPSGRWNRHKFDAIPQELRKAMLWTTCGGEDRCLEQLLRAPGYSTVVGGGALPELILLDSGEITLVQRLVGDVLVDRTAEVQDALIRAARRALPKQKPSLQAWATAWVSVEQRGLSGQLGLVEQGPASARIWHRGIPLGDHPLDLPEGVIAAVEWEDAMPDSRLEGLADPEQLDQLVQALREAAFQLIESEARKRHLDQPLAPWLVDGLVEGRLAEVPLFRTTEGEARSLKQLEPPIRATTQPPAFPWPAMSPLLIADKARLQVLRGCLGVGRVEDLTHRVVERNRAWASYRARDTVPFALSRAWGKRVFELPGLTGLAGLCLDANREGLRVAVLLHDRLLCTLAAPCSVPAVAVVRGELEPTAGWDGPMDGKVAKAIEAAALQAVEALRRQALDAPGLPVPLARRLLAVAPATHALARQRLLPGLGQPLSLSRVLLDEQPVWTLPKDTLSNHVPKEGHWIRLEPGVRQLLEAHVPRAQEGGLELSNLEAGMARRATLRRVSLASSSQEHLTAWTVTEGTTRLWVALRDGEGSARLDWIVDEREVLTETRDDLPHAWFRVTDDELRANTAFSLPRVGPARDRCLELVMKVASTLALRAARALGEPGAPLVRDGGALLRATIRLLATQRPGPEFEGLPLLPTSDGRTLDALELEQVARRGPLRVVGPSVRGRTLNPERPALQADIHLRMALNEFRRVVDYSDELARDEEVHARREAPAERPTPSPEALLVRELEAPLRGFVEVHRDGRSALNLSVGWRPVETRRQKGHVPLVIHCDGDFVPDEAWRKLTGTPELQAALEQLEALSNSLVDELIQQDPLGHHHPGLWQAVIPRCLSHRRDVKPRNGFRGQLAAMEIFMTGDGERLTAAALTKLRKPLWVPQELAMPSIDPKRPFVVAPKGDLKNILSFWGGEDGTELARDRKAALARRQSSRRPFRLRPVRWLAERQEEASTWRVLAALDPHLPRESRLEVRVDGVMVQMWTERGWPGLEGVVEVPESQVDESFRRANKTRAQDRALDALYARLVLDAAEEVRSSILVRRQLATLLQDLAHNSKALKAWCASELLPGPTPATLDQARERTVVWSSTPIEGALALAEDPSSKALLEALKIPHQTRKHWLEDRRKQIEAQTQQSQAARRARQEAALRETLAAHLGVLTSNLEGARALREEILASPLQGEHLAAALDDDEGPAAWMLAWNCLDARLVAQARYRDAAEVAVRVGERVAKRP